MCGNMVEIQSPAAEIRRGKKIDKEETTGQKYNVRICYAGRPWLSRWESYWIDKFVLSNFEVRGRILCLDRICSLVNRRHDRNERLYKYATCAFLASVVIVPTARPVLEPVLRVTDAYSLIIRFTARPVSIHRRVAVVPPSSSVRYSCLFVQAEPVLSRNQEPVLSPFSVFTSQNINIITV